MLAFLGIVLLIVGLASWAVPKYFFDLEDPPFTVPKKVPFLAGSIGGGLLALSIIFGGLFFSAEAGHVYFVQYNVPIPGLNGKQVVHTDPGYHLRLYGNVMAMKQVLTIKCDSNTKDNGDSRETCNEINVRFNDNVTADVSVAARFRLPTDEAKLKKLFLEYRSEENLINTSLIPQIMSVLRNAARLISAQEYMMGKGGDFEQAVLDQMQNGLYILETETILSHPEEQTVNKERTIERGETIKVIVRKKVDATGNPAHISHSFSEYGVTVTQAAIAHVDPEAKYKETLGKQRDAAAEASVSQQQAKKAEFEKQRIIAEGEAQKAQIQVDQEKAQVQKRIEAETSQRVAGIVANTEKEVAAIQLEKKKLELQQVEVDAAKTRATASAASDAKKSEAAGLRALNEANNSLDAKLQAWVTVNKAYAESFGAKGVVPQIVMGGGNSGTSGASQLIDLLTVHTAQQLKLDVLGAGQAAPAK